MYRLILIVVVNILLLSCASEIYSPDAFSRTRSHQLIAIAPPRVSIATRKQVDMANIEEQQKLGSKFFQQEMYDWLINVKKQNRLTVDIQKVDETNAVLMEAGYFGGKPLTPNEICYALGVDAIITSNYSIYSPMSTQTASAFNFFYWGRGKTNNANVTLRIHDKEKNKLLWMFNRKINGKIESDSADLVDELMIRASSEMPYIKRAI